MNSGIIDRRIDTAGEPFLCMEDRHRTQTSDIIHRVFVQFARRDPGASHPRQVLQQFRRGLIGPPQPLHRRLIFNYQSFSPLRYKVPIEFHHTTRAATPIQHWGPPTVYSSRHPAWGQVSRCIEGPGLAPAMPPRPTFGLNPPIMNNSIVSGTRPLIVTKSVTADAEHSNLPVAFLH